MHLIQPRDHPPRWADIREYSWIFLSLQHPDAPSLLYHKFILDATARSNGEDCSFWDSIDSLLLAESDLD